MIHELINPVSGKRYSFSQHEDPNSMLYASQGIQVAGSTATISGTGATSLSTTGLGSQHSALSKTSNFCPLHSVGCIFNAENIWANVQPEDDPRLMSWDLTDTSRWKPFFTEKHSKSSFAAPPADVDLQTLQRSQLAYFSTSEQYYIDRASRIERLIEQQIQSWRRGQLTRWDYGGLNQKNIFSVLVLTHKSVTMHTAMRKLRLALPSLELSLLGSSAEVNQFIAELQKIRASYEDVFGFPLQFKDSGDENILTADLTNPILQAIQQTRVHENEHPDVVCAAPILISFRISPFLFSDSPSPSMSIHTAIDSVVSGSTSLRCAKVVHLYEICFSFLDTS